MTRAQRAAAWAILAALVALVFLFATACKAEPDDDFSRKCAAKGWVVHTRHVGNSTSRVCAPPPQPTPGPNGRWQ